MPVHSHPAGARIGGDPPAGKSRHICHVTTAHPWFDTRIFERMCLGLVRLGYRVTLVAPVDHPRREQGVEIVPTGLRGKAARLFRGDRLLRRLRAIDADIYHFHDPELLPWMYLFRRTSRKRVIYDVHEYYPETVVDSNYFGWRPLSRLAGKAFGLAEPLLARGLDGVTGVSPPIVERFEGGRTPVVLARNLLALESLPPRLEPVELPSPLTLVVAGVLDYNRLMPELIEALAILAPNWPDLTVLAVGDLDTDPYGAELRALARRLGVSDRFVVRPRVRWAALQAHLARSAAGLVLYRDRENNRVALPNRLFEFMAQGVPIVASNYPLLAEVVSQAGCGILLEDDRPATIAAGIEALLRDPAEARRMGERGRAALHERHHWGIDLTAVTALYERL
jgi:glycosyltransferase involved in cell wall biosynthesis